MFLTGASKNNMRQLNCKMRFEEEDDDYDDVRERLRKTLYYGRNPTIDRSSLSLTELAVEFTRDAAPRELGAIDMYLASSMSKRACMSPCSMMLGMLYIERLKKSNPHYLKKVYSSDLFLISIMMASKYLYDEGEDEEVFNDEWAESAKVDLDDLNELELEFLKAIEWELFMNPTDFFNLMADVEQRIAIDKGLGRHWLSYTDLWVILQDDRYSKIWIDILRHTMQVFSVFSVAYVAGMLTMVGSVLLMTSMSASIPPHILHTSVSRPQIMCAENQTCLSTDASEWTVIDENIPDDNASSSYDDDDGGHIEDNDSNATDDAQPEAEPTNYPPKRPGFVLGNVLPQILAIFSLKESFMECMHPDDDTPQTSGHEFVGGSTSHKCNNNFHSNHCKFMTPFSKCSNLTNGVVIS